ncbi:hypothetical protein IWQ61_002249 [Dispira simplex]|nr:hypothetical protein IWQ61_002249 [Dispira simplex]
MAHASSGIIYVIVCGSNNARFNIGYPCFMLLWLSHILVFINGSTFTLKNFRFLFMIQDSKNKLQELVHPSPEIQGLLDESPKSGTGVSISLKPLSTTQRNHSSQDENVRPKGGLFTRFLLHNKHFFRSEQRLMMLVAVLALVVLAYVLVMQFTFSKFSIQPLELTCSFGAEYTLLIVIIVIIAVIIHPFLLFKLWNVTDGYGIRQELIVSSIALTIFPTAVVVWALVPGKHSYYFASMNWYAVVIIVVHSSSVVYPLILQARNPELRLSFSGGLPQGQPASATDMYPSDWSRFLAMLCDPSGRERLRNWSTQYFLSELVVFLEEYQELKRFLANTFPPPPRSAEALAKSGSQTQPPVSPGVISLNSSQGLNLNEKAEPVDLDSTTEVNRSIREIWNLPSQQEPSLATHTNISRASLTSYSVPLVYGPDISCHSSLQLAYYMFYQRFFEYGSDFKVGVSPVINNMVESRALAGDMTADIFDDAREEVLKMLFNEVYLKSVYH